MPPKRRALTPLERHEICKGDLRGGRKFFLIFISAGSGLANIIYMVAEIIYFEELVQSSIHRMSVIAR